MQLSPQAMRDLPSDVWSTLARAALAAEGDGLAAWLRLSLVCRAWRDSLAGACDMRTVARTSHGCTRGPLPNMPRLMTLTSSWCCTSSCAFQPEVNLAPTLSVWGV